MNAIAAIWYRDVLRTVRNIGVVISALLIPSIFLASFYGVFAHAAEALGFDYASFLLPAGLLQALIFTAGGSALAFARDAEGGVHDRIKTLPVSTSSIIVGRLLADITRFTWSGAVVVIVALLLGAKLPSDAKNLVLWLLLFYVMTIVVCAAVDALSLSSKHPVSTAMVVQSLTIAVVMFSTAYVPGIVLTGAIGKAAQHMPFSSMLDTARALQAGVEAGRDGWLSIAWLALFGVLAIWGLARNLRRNHG